ncbi:MAG: FAD-dependent oxidoreductase [Candidatus Kariarchaeaceae archaeon]|jgi:phytoene dehydrogenase-like protein
MEPKSYDVIIIGAGLGGLAAGAILSQAGKSVLMIEQHNIVGGAATHFVRKRTMRFEVGLHELDGMGRDSKRQLFKDLGILDRLELVQVPEFYRVSRGDFEFTMPDG